MPPFWVLALGLGLVWFATRRGDPVLRALTDPAAIASVSSNAPGNPPGGATNPGGATGVSSPAPPGNAADPLRVDTPPTITAAQINQTLAAYHSPAAGLGQVIYDEGVRNGINPAVALAFFIHESQAGTQGPATVTKSIGNIKATGSEPSYQGFKKYGSWQAGIADYYRLIRQVYIGQWGLNTVDRIIPVYAPTIDGNNPGGYINAVKDLVRGWMHASPPTIN